MKYMGSKNRIAKQILEIVLKERDSDQWYVEPFCGGCNVIDKVRGKRIACDSNKYLIAMWKALISGWVPPIITKEEYAYVRDNKSQYKDYFIGWVGFNCSYGGKFFGGFAGITHTKINTVRDYQKEAHKNVFEQIDKLKDVKFLHKSFADLKLSSSCLIYCDPPYANTTTYTNKFDHTVFWNWVRKMSEYHTVFVSEYNAPNDFECVWEKEVKSSLSANGVGGGSKKSNEKLFVFKG